MNEEKVFEKLEGMDTKLDDLLQWKAVHQEGHKIIDRDLVEVRDTLFDNPGGLKSQVQTLINGNRTISRWRDFGRDILKYIIIAAILAIFTWWLVLYQKGGSTETENNESHVTETVE